MKQIYFIGSLGKGGAERVISILGNHQSDIGNEVVICTLLDKNIDYKIDKKVKIVHLVRDKSKFLNLFYWIVGIRRLVKEHKPEIVISFIARVNILVLASTFLLPTKVLVSERNNPIRDGRSPIIKSLTFMLYPKAAHIVFQTNEVKQMFTKRIQRKSSIIANPIMSDLPIRTSYDDRIVSIGRLEKQKNQVLLIRAFKNIIDKYNSVSLHFYGNGSELDNLLREIKVLELEHAVFLHGVQNEVHNEVKNAKLFILTSRYEGLSNALMEALSIGIPAIGSDVLGINNLISHGETGLLFQENNQKDLEEKIAYALENYDILQVMSNNGKNEMKKYEEAIIMETWNKTIMSIVGK